MGSKTAVKTEDTKGRVCSYNYTHHMLFAINLLNKNHLSITEACPEFCAAAHSSTCYSMCDRRGGGSKGTSLYDTPVSGHRQLERLQRE